ncbi:MAG: uncharacterized protein JWM80_882 [Cyanobacteria bacterium RYN_339]|nr:uncharacterized protein [Cyanobacteria bacterium RYN_339]
MARDNLGAKREQPKIEPRVEPYTAHFGRQSTHNEHTHKGVVYCAGCHAIGEHKRWALDENRYKALAMDPAIQTVQCPGCERAARQEYDGEVTLTSPLIPRNEEAVLGLIYNTERHIRENNPIARIASLTLEGDTIRILTITPFLAERIGKELHKAYDGTLKLSHPEREEFVRVTWIREE